jgi:hypothetical protein
MFVALRSPNRGMTYPDGWFRQWLPGSPNARRLVSEFERRCRNIRESRLKFREHFVRTSSSGFKGKSDRVRKAGDGDRRGIVSCALPARCRVVALSLVDCDATHMTHLLSTDTHTNMAVQLRKSKQTLPDRRCTSWTCEVMFPTREADSSWVCCDLSPANISSPILWSNTLTDFFLLTTEFYIASTQSWRGINHQASLNSSRTDSSRRWNITFWNP